MHSLEVITSSRAGTCRFWDKFWFSAKTLTGWVDQNWKFFLLASSSLLGALCNGICEDLILHLPDLFDLVLHAEHLHGLPQLFLLVRAQLLLSRLSIFFRTLSTFSWVGLVRYIWTGGINLFHKTNSPFFPFFPPWLLPSTTSPPLPFSSACSLSAITWRPLKSEKIFSWRNAAKHHCLSAYVSPAWIICSWQRVSWFHHLNWLNSYAPGNLKPVQTACISFTGAYIILALSFFPVGNRFWCKSHPCLSSV